MSTTTLPDSAAGTRGTLRVAVVLVIGVIAPLLDSTIVNVALGTLSRDLGVTLATIQWITTAYLLAMAVAVPFSGWASERFGARAVWLAALGLFLVGSVLAGVAWGVAPLVAFRVLQGFGAGLLMPLLQTILIRSTGGRPSAGVLALAALPTMLGPVLGPVLGGLILDNLSWRWIFYVNPPIIVLALVLAWRYLPATPPRPGHRLDVPGLLLVTPGVVAAIYALVQVGEVGGVGDARVTVPAALAVVLLAAFAWYAGRAADPIVDLRLFRVPSFTAAALLMFASGAASFGAMLLLPLYYQQLRGSSVLVAGLLLAPQGVGIALSRAAGSLMGRLGARTIAAVGMGLTALGTLPFAFADATTSPLWLSLALVVRGAGLGSVFMVVMVAAYTDLAPEQVTHGSTLTRILQQIGGSVGAAVFSVILQRQLASHPGAAGAATAFDATFWWATGLTVLAVLPAFWLVAPRTTAERG